MSRPGPITFPVALHCDLSGCNRTSPATATLVAANRIEVAAPHGWYVAEEVPDRSSYPPESEEEERERTKYFVARCPDHVPRRRP
jgi:hypothetical protein